MKYIFSILFSFTILSESIAQVPVTINSGSPNFPFPQFNAYKYESNHNLGNLGTQTPVGVTHSEMEQRMRDAWQIMANSFVYTNKTLNGIKYIQGNIGCPYDCAEGEGYSMLGAAYMGDKTIFDGLWLRNHDLRLTSYPRYSDCVVTNPNYKYGKNSLLEPIGDAAADGSFDIALALLVAWKQWGEFMGINDACGNPISYKVEALKIIKGLVEIQNSGYGDCRSISGCVGLDGYIKNGNTYGETTSWANNHLDACPEFNGSQSLFVDYMAPSYFREFRIILEAQGANATDISQLARAEASSDWIMSKTITSTKGIPFAGKGDIVNDQVTFSNFNQAEDFRLSWRTNLNHVWHGNPNFTWNPTSHQIINNSPNTFEKDVALKYTEFLKNNSQSPWNNTCVNPGSGDLTYKGTDVLSLYDKNGLRTSFYNKNWIIGASASSVVSAQDYQLMAEFFRRCVVEFDISNKGDGYLSSTPQYYDGWFRLLGMLTLTGNFQAPEQMIPGANLKIYKSISNSVAKLGDTITYTLDYRNYGSVNATNSKISTVIDPSFEILSVSNAGVKSSNLIEWNLGTIPGLKGNNLSSTMNKVSFTVRVKDDTRKTICGTATISASNSNPHTSNEYPNNKTAVMERNCLDVVPNPIKLTSTIDSLNLKNGNEAIVKIDFENQKSAALTGGRPKVYLAYGNDNTSTNGAMNLLKARIFHGADEAYIDYGNYRLSLFIYDTTFKCLQNSAACNFNNSISVTNQIYEGGKFSDVVISQEKLLSGSDANGLWNQKISFQFDHALASTTPHLQGSFGVVGKIHEGVTEPLRSKWMLNASNYSSINWAEDWSWNNKALSNDNSLYLPISPSYTGSIVEPINTWHPDACTNAPASISNVLVEEWDGHIWRKAYGNAPVEGQAQHNFIIRDTLPDNLEFISFVDQKALGYNATYYPSTRIVELAIPTFYIGAKESISYKVRAFKNKDCPSPIELTESKIHFSSKEQNTAKSVYKTSLYCGLVTSLNENTLTGISVFPNPTTTGFKVATEEKNLNYELVDLAGKTIEKGQLTELGFGIHLERGTYILKLISNTNSYSQLIQKN